MSSVVRALAFVGLAYLGTVNASEINLLVIGDDVQSACLGASRPVYDNVLEVNAGGAATLVQGTGKVMTCTGTNTWTRFGEQILRMHKVEKIRFVSIGKSDLIMDELLLDGPIRTRLGTVIDDANRLHRRFDYVLVQQGESGSGYQYKLGRFMRMVSREVRVDKWIVAQVSGCDGVSDKKILAAQAHTGSNPLFSRYLGPNIDALGKEYRIDGKCAFNEAGERKLAALWIDAVRKADAADEIFQKESLLYFFKR